MNFNTKYTMKSHRSLTKVLAGLVAFHCSLFVLVGFTSCEDMLNVETGDKSYVNANDTLYSYLGILKKVQNIAERQIILNELRGDLCSPTEFVTDTLHAIANFDDPQNGSCSMLDITDYYAVINNCNLYIANADTNKIKSNVKYMIPEYAQVQAIRAWTYLQLVNLYGEVPFISEPIASLDVIKNFNYNANLVNKDNLVDRLVELGLDRYTDTKYPSYGAFQNGAVQLSSRLFFFPVNLVLGDLYLLRGANESDYRRAAQYYYNYLSQTSSVTTEQYVSATKLRGAVDLDDPYVYTNNRWGSYASNYTYSATGEVITIIPSSANKQFGTMLMRVADIFGYTPSSSQKTENSTNADGDEESTVSGNISVTPSAEPQIVPSAGYKAINKAQSYVYWNSAGNDREYFTSGDARYHQSVQEITFHSSNYDSARHLVFACKAAKTTTFYYAVPVYRRTLVWLRLAEAINRAGFPEHAFAILKDGLNEENLPKINLTRIIMQPVLDENGEPVYDENGLPMREPVEETYDRYASNGACNYISHEEAEAFFLSFNNDLWLSNYGIHARGCGFGSWTGTTSRSVVTNITGNHDDLVFNYVPRLAAEGVNIKDCTKEDIINAVENIICDELALELAFEGYRFSDLVRMANHKIASGYDGAAWLAAKIADRNVREASADGQTPAVTRDTELYNRLVNNRNLWYFTKPAWKK